MCRPRKGRGPVAALLRALCETTEDTGWQVRWLYAAHGDDAAYRAITDLGQPCTAPTPMRKLPSSPCRSLQHQLIT
jgi:hypothetical protein